LTKTGGLDISKPDNPYFQSIIASAKKYQLDVELLTREQVTEKFPVMRLTPGVVALYSPDGGLLNATKCVAMYQSLAHKNGCVLKDNSVVKNLVEDLNENLVSVHVSDGHVYRGKKVIVTAGPWSKKLLKETQGLDLPLVTKLSTVSYWKVNDPTAYSWERFPAQLLHGDAGHEGHGAFPLREYPNMIKCASFAGTDCDPDNRSFGKADGKIEAELGEYVRTMLTGVDTEPTLVESCIYTLSPDFDFILDKIQGASGNGNIIIGCGFSGHGFKLAPVVGKILSQLAINGRDFYSDDISKFFKLRRFKN
jgi:sarcosine oxidase/L-pipecolate oxidase